MLTPTYLAGISVEVVEIYAKVEQDIANDIVKRVLRTGYVTSYSEWQMKKAREIGLFRQGVTDVLGKASAEAGDEVKLLLAQAAKDSLATDDSIYRKAGLKPLPISQSPALQALILQGKDSTLQLLSNFTKTTSIEANTAFQSILDKTYIKILSGAYTPQKAIHDAIKELASNGMNRVAYQSAGGNVHYDSAEVAVRRAVTTGINQSIAKLQLARADEMECELVETTSHSSARPSHAVWQGQVYSLTKRRSDYPDFYDSTGYGTGEGLCGWNCYHSFYPFFEGLSTRAFAQDPASMLGRNNEEEYMLQQKQRYYERRIREAKREVTTLNTAIEASKDEALADELREDFTAASMRLKNREGALKKFLEQNGRSREWYREQTGDWNRSVSAKAAWANKKARK